MEFKKLYPFDIRTKTSFDILTKCPDKIPIIVQPSSKSRLTLSRRKFLTPKDFSLLNFMSKLREHVHNLHHNATLFLLLENGTIPLMTLSIDQLYHRYSDPDGFLYIIICEENVFG